MLGHPFIGEASMIAVRWYLPRVEGHPHSATPTPLAPWLLPPPPQQIKVNFEGWFKQCFFTFKFKNKKLINYLILTFWSFQHQTVTFATRKTPFLERPKNIYTWFQKLQRSFDPFLSHSIFVRFERALKAVSLGTIWICQGCWGWRFYGKIQS